MVAVAYIYQQDIPKLVEGNALLLGDALREKGFAITQPQARIAPSAVGLLALSSRAGSPVVPAVSPWCISAGSGMTVYIALTPS